MTSSLDILYVTHNRREFTEASFSALIANTNWALVKGLYVYDDHSTDGTLESILRMCDNVPLANYVHVVPGKFGGPVAAMNRFIADVCPGVFAKIDNDTMVPAYWVEAGLAALRVYPYVDLLGIEARYTEPSSLVPLHGQIIAASPDIAIARFIGGIGFMRGRAFQGRELPSGDHGRFGFGVWQGQHPEVVKAWLMPPLPVFLLDHLPFEPWRGLSEKYTRLKWQREQAQWKYYGVEYSGLWEWWEGAGDWEKKMPRERATV